MVEMVHKQIHTLAKLQVVVLQLDKLELNKVLLQVQVVQVVQVDQAVQVDQVDLLHLLEAF